MAYGGGTFTVQNKKLPGSYINVVSATRTSTVLGDRGIVGVALNLDWGAETIFSVTADDFIKDSYAYFGYAYDADELANIRDLFKNANQVYFYRLNAGGAKATSTYAEAKYAGVAGNKISIRMEANPDGGVDVVTLFNTVEVDNQHINNANELVNNDYVTFKSFELPSLTNPVITALTGGTNATLEDEAVTAAHTTFLSLIEGYPVNVVLYDGTSATVALLYDAFVKRVRDKLGVKIQVVYSYNIVKNGTMPDYEGIVVANGHDTDVSYIYWVAGALAGCPINRTLTNKLYDGEAPLKPISNQAQLEALLDKGVFAFHQVGEEMRVLDDINTLTTTTETKGEDFKSNQTMRVLDQSVTDIATIFNTQFLGLIPNDANGRVALWNTITSYFKRLESIRAIENFDPNTVVVTKGNTKKDVVVSAVITPTNAMTHLYMTLQIQ